MSGLVGWITTRPMRPVKSRPRCCQVLPASVDLYMPLPIEIWLRIHASPVPAHTTFSSDGATASAPIDCTGWSSKIGCQWMPPSVVFQMPPDAEHGKASVIVALQRDRPRSQPARNLVLRARDSSLAPFGRASYLFPDDDSPLSEQPCLLPQTRLRVPQHRARGRVLAHRFPRQALPRRRRRRLCRQPRPLQPRDCKLDRRAVPTVRLPLRHDVYARAGREPCRRACRDAARRPLEALLPL